jgi:TRAP-type uncharacterized transport system substrate-binding protein
MKRIGDRKSAPVLLVIGAALWVGTSLQSGARGEGGPELLGIATGPPHQTFHAIGQGLAEVINERAGQDAMPGKSWLNAVAVATEGSGQNASLIARRQPQRIYYLSRLLHQPSGGVKTGEPYWALERAKPGREVDLEPRAWQVPSQSPTRVILRLGVTSSLTPYLSDFTSLSPAERRRIQGLAVLWNEYLHLVVRPKLPDRVQSLTSLKRHFARNRPLIYLGPFGSATRRVAEALLERAGLNDQYWDATTRPKPGCAPVATFDDAAGCLSRGDIDAAFFLSGLPNPAVEKALRKECRLLPAWGKPLGKPDLSEDRFLRHLDPDRIPATAYAASESAGMRKARARSDIPTLTSKALLVGSDLTDDQVREILQCIFDARASEAGQEELLEHHEVAEQIRLLTTVEERGAPLQSPRRKWMPFRFHPGARAFWDEEEKKLKIAGGPLEGTSFRLGLDIVRALEDHNIHARLVNTDGDEESIQLLKQKKADLALLHSDAAAVGFGEMSESQGPETTAWPAFLRPVAKWMGAVGEPNGLRLLSFLYPEAVHVLTVRLPARHLQECRALRALKVTKEPSDFKALVGLLIKLRKVSLLALADEKAPERGGDLPPDRQTEVLLHYARLLGKDDVINGVRRGNGLTQLSIAEAQNRLVTGQIAAALVTSGVPMEALEQLLSPEQIPRLKRLLEDGQQCPYCERPLTSPLGVRLLPLQAPSGSGVSAAAETQAREPDTIRGLVANYRWFEPFVIPPNTYPGAQTRPADTAAVKVLLTCRQDCPDVFQIAAALVEDEVRLRSTVRGINLHNPLLQDKDEPSIPVHPAARQYYFDQGILQRLPPRSGFWWESVHPYLLPGIFGLIMGSLLPAWFGRSLATWRARRRVRYERQLRDAYFQELRNTQFGAMRNRTRQLDELEGIWAQVLNAYGRKLTPGEVEALDKQARDYREYLRKEMGTDA